MSAAAAATSAGVSYKVVVLGGGGVGKSALTIRFVTNRFLDVYDPTVEDSYMKELVVDDQLTRLEILDTAGQEEFSSLQQQWMRGGDGFLFVYSIANRDSFVHLQSIYKTLRQSIECDKIPLVVVGNKCDLADQRDVRYDEGKELAASMNAVFLEASAKNSVNVSECFIDLVKDIRMKGSPVAAAGNARRSSKKAQSCCVVL